MKKEYYFLNYFNIRTFFLGIGLSRIIKDTKSLCFISIALGTIMGIIILKLFNKEIKNTLVNVILASTLFVIALMIITNMISSMFLTEMPKFLVALPIILVIFYILTKKERVIYRITNILIVINITLFIITIMALLPYVKSINFTYNTIPLKNILIASLEYALLSTTPILISKDKKHYKIPIIKTYVISSLSLALAFALVIGILGANTVSVYRYPEYVVLKRITLFNNSANLENILCFYWIFDALMFLTTCANLMKKTLGLKGSMIWIIILTLITGIINSNYIYIAFIYNHILSIFIVVITLLFFLNKKEVDG